MWPFGSDNRKTSVDDLDAKLAGIDILTCKLRDRIESLERKERIRKSERRVGGYKKLIGKKVEFRECFDYQNTDYFGGAILIPGKRIGKLIDIVIDTDGRIKAHLKGQGCFDIGDYDITKSIERI